MTRGYDGTGLGELLVDGRSAGSMAPPTRNRFVVTILWSALDAVLDRGSPVRDYPASPAFTGEAELGRE